MALGIALMKNASRDINICNGLTEILYLLGKFKRPHKISQILWEKGHLAQFIKPQCLQERW